ncbi:hypothetical protein [Nonomuraea dietziae]|uniref:hypothetical protein n=1 Tax=Nonomuraea dietziae TaxID=65515 RepID=UPI0033C0E90F
MAMVRGNDTRGWATVAVVLTTFALAGVALVLGLEAMSWIAAAIGVVLAVIALFAQGKATAETGTESRVEAGADPRQSRRGLGRAHKAVLAGGLVVIVGAAVFLKVIAPQGPTEATACPRP